MSFFNFQPQNDIDRGRQAVTYFHNDSTSYDAYSGTTLNQLIDKISTDSRGNPRPDIFLDAFGFAISANSMSDGQVSQAMQKLADLAQGRIPNNQQVFFKALSDRLQDITTGDWLGALPEIAGNTALTAVKGVEEIGNTVITTGKGLLTIMPVLVIGAVVFIVAMRSKQLAGA